MKKATIFAAFALITFSSFAQAKKDTSVNHGSGQTADYKIPAPKQYALLLNESDLSNLLAVIGSSGKLTGDKIIDYRSYLEGKIVLLPPPAADTVKPKK